MRKVKIDKQDDLEESFSQAMKAVIKDMPISGAQRINLYQSGNGELFVHMTIQKREVAEQLDNMKGAYKKHMEEAKQTREIIDEGMKVLDEMINDLDSEKK